MGKCYLAESGSRKWLVSGSYTHGVRTLDFSKTPQFPNYMNDS